MSEAVTSCAAHRGLVAEAMGPDPSDAAHSGTSRA